MAVEKQNIVLGDMEVEYMDVNDILPNPYNPNRQSEKDFELLCRSMEEDGFTQPVIIRKSDNLIVDGEHRWRAAQSIGMKAIPVVKVEMTDAQMRISTLRHNRARGSEDMDLASDVLKQLQDMGALDHAKDSLMMDDVEMKKYLSEVEQMADNESIEAQTANAIFLDENGVARPAHEVDASTEGAADAKRKMRDDILKMKGKENQMAIYRDHEVFKLGLTYLAEEANIIRSVCGKNIAEGILMLCTKEFEKRGLTL